MEQVLTLRFVEERIQAAQLDVARANSEIDAAKKRIDGLNGEIGDLLAAGRVLIKLSGQLQSAPVESPTNVKADEDEFDPNENTGNPYRPSTNKYYMWKVLRDADRVWMTANEIQELATRLRGAEIPMSSVSPGLSDMKQDGSIERDGLKVALKSRLQENGALNGHAVSAPEAGEVTASPNENQSRTFEYELG